MKCFQVNTCRKKQKQDRSHQWSSWPVHSPGRLWLSLDFEVLGWMYVHVWTDICMDTLSEYSDHYYPGLWSASWINKYQFKTEFATLRSKTHYNVGKNSGLSKDARFWSQVSPDVVKDVLHYFRMDFKMFNYSPRDYFTQLELDKLAILAENDI